MNKKDVENLNAKFENSTPNDVIEFFTNKYENKIALSSSLGIEDQVLTDIIVGINKDIKIFTLDTGRLFPETYDLIHKTNSKYKIFIKIYFPNALEVEKMVNEKGINLFYQSVENRIMCCNIRKMGPLKRAFKGLDAWICGLRNEQSDARKNIKLIEWDENNELLKINPLINYSEQEIWDYINKHNVPFNLLHKKGFTSIGCQPCTRAITKGENIRAGRWWWENTNSKECGLHVS